MLGPCPGRQCFKFGNTDPDPHKQAHRCVNNYRTFSCFLLHNTGTYIFDGRRKAVLNLQIFLFLRIEGERIQTQFHFF